MTKLPSARTANLVVQLFDDETLIYDLSVSKAFCLNENAARIFKACEEGKTFEDLKKTAEFSDDVIFFALDELKRFDLIEDYEDSASPFHNLSRRDVIKKIGFSSMVALPAIYALIAPTAVQAQSGFNYTCSNPGAATSSFCASSPAACTTNAKTLCANCGASASTSGLCSANPTNTVTCTCGGATCSNPGATTSSFCASPASGCSDARTFCANCSATGSTSGLCSANPVNTLTCTCT